MLDIKSKSFSEAKGSKLYMDSMYVNDVYTPVTAVKLNSFKVLGFSYKRNITVSDVNLTSSTTKRFSSYCLKVLGKNESKMPTFKDKVVHPTYFKIGDFIDVQSNSKGKGFQGVIKRWGFAKQPMTHGSMSHRRGGSYGNRE